MDSKKIFAKNLKRAMEAKGVNRRELSEVLGISYFTISDWATGKKQPRMDNVERLANYFGVSNTFLLDDNSTTENIPRSIILTEGEDMLLDLFRQVPENKQQMVLEMIRAALKNQ